MGQSVIRNPRKIHSQSGGDPSLPSRVTTLENNEYKITYYEIISGASGSLTLPTGATINAGEFGLSGNCILSKIDGSNKPTFESPKTAGGTIVTASLNETTGAWVASGTYTDANVALIYSIKIKAINYSNLTYANIIETTDDTGNYVKKGTLTTNYIPKATSSDTIGDSSITDDGTTVNISVSNSKIVASGIASYIKFDNGINEGYLQNRAASTAISHSDLIEINAPLINVHQLTPSQIVETDASKNLVSAAKGTAYNKDFGTGTTNIVEIGSTLGNSLISATDSNGKLQTLNTATYPSLTELTYVKGATSALQTQLNSKASNFINKLNTDYTHTGTLLPTVIHSFEILPNTCEANDVLKFYLRHFSNSAGSKTIKLKANSVNDVSTATTIATYTYTTTAPGVFPLKRSMFFKNSLTSQIMINTTISHANDDVSYPNNGDTSLALDFNNSVFIFVEITLGVAANTFTMNLFNCKIER